MAKTYKSEASMVIHGMAEGPYENGIIDKVTMKEFDDTCLVPTPQLTPEEIRNIRASAGLSQPAFARYVNVSKNLVSDWCQVRFRLSAKFGARRPCEKVPGTT